MPLQQKKSVIPGALFLFAMLLSGCGGETILGEDSSTNNPVAGAFLTAVRNSSPISACPAGGISVDTGRDQNGSGILESFEVTSTLYVCNGENGADGANGLSALASITLEPAGANCTTGGTRISAGKDANGNGVLEPGEITATTYACNGATGAAGANGANGADGANGLSTLIAVVAEPPSANCTYGGNKTSSGLDANVNGVLDPGEVTSTTYVCNGATGASGANGANGANGSNGLTTLIAVVAEPPSANCTYGGNKTSSGLDANVNGILDPGEVTSTTYVCNGATGASGANGANGANGSNGLTTLIAVVAEPPSANCTYGGNKTSSGLDANVNGVLDPGEVTSTTYVCNGATGAAGANGANGSNGLTTLIAVVAEPPSANCTYGGNKTSSGLDANVNGVLDPGEVTSTTYVCNGATGAAGANGANGANGADGANGLSTLIAVVAEPPSANCTYGGNKTSSGLDANVNGVLDPGEVTSTTYVCNGATGAAGANGANGANGADGANGLSTLIAVVAEPPSANCTYGGNKTSSGLDANVNGVLDPGEVTSTTYVCNGATGAAGANGANGANGSNGLTTLIAVVAEPPSANCTYGGNKTSSGLDANVNGVLEPGEVTSTTYVCNGATGAAGANGANGSNGLTTLIAVVAEPPSANCTYGGNKTSSGLDANVNGVLDPGEVTSTTYVCNGATGAAGANGANGANGADGANGLTTLIAVVAEPPSANCTYGGNKTSSGLDANVNGILEPGEVTSTTYVCNGATGAAGGGLAAYGHIYNLAEQTVSVGAAVAFDNSGVLLGMSRPDTSTIQLASSGTYDLWFSLSGSEPNQFAFFVNGSVVPGSIYGSGAGTQQNSGRMILTLTAGDLITLVNYGSAASVTLPSFTGGSQPNVNASIIIQKLD